MAKDPNGAPPGYWYDTSTHYYVIAPAGTYAPGGTQAPIADPGGTFSAAGAWKPSQDPAGTYSSPYALDRLFIEWKNITPDNGIFTFSNETAVANYYGRTSIEANEAKTFFGGYLQPYAWAGATMTFIRTDYQQRPHLLGINLAPVMSLAQLRTVQGDMDINFNGVWYEPHVDLSGVTSWVDAAQTLTADINSRLPVLANVQASIRPVSNTFSGQVIAAHLYVTDAPAGTVKVGSIISGAGISSVGNNSSAPVQVIGQINGTPGGDGEYSIFAYGGNTPIETITDSYGILTTGTQHPWDYGQLAEGDTLVTGQNNIAPKTGVISQISGGTGAGAQWLVNIAQTVPDETIGVRATPLQAYLDWNDIPINGKTTNNDFFDIAPGGLFGFNNQASDISYANDANGGNVATRLGLTQADGALLVSPGGENDTVANFMNTVLTHYTSHFASIESSIPNQLTALQEWDALRGGGNDAFNILTTSYTTTPAGQATAVTDPIGSTSGPGASFPTL